MELKRFDSSVHPGSDATGAWQGTNELNLCRKEVESLSKGSCIDYESWSFNRASELSHEFAQRAGKAER